MARTLLLKVSAATAALVFGIPLAFAQTGPTGPAAAPQVPALSGPTAPGAQQNKMTADRLANLLRGDGWQVEIKPASNGYQVVHASVVRDGWRFQFEFEYNPNQTNFNIVCPLGNPGTQYSASQLLEILKKSYDLPVPIHFSYRANDQRLVLEDPLFNPVNMTDAFVRQTVDQLMQHMRNTYSLWGAPAQAAAK